jgi:ribosome-associated protein
MIGTFRPRATEILNDSPRNRNIAEARDRPDKRTKPLKKPAKKTARKTPAKKATPSRKTTAKKPPAKTAGKAARKPAAKKAVARTAVKTAARRKKPAAPRSGLLDLVTAQLEDAKAEAISTIDLAGKGAIADFMVVASGRSSRHVGAIADQLVEKLKLAGRRDLRVEGMPQCDWVLVDAGDVVVHLFRPEVRSFYNLEKLWSVHSPHERRPE